MQVDFEKISDKSKESCVVDMPTVIRQEEVTSVPDTLTCVQEVANTTMEMGQLMLTTAKQLPKWILDSDQAESVRTRHFVHFIEQQFQTEANKPEEKIRQDDGEEEQESSDQPEVTDMDMNMDLLDRKEHIPPQVEICCVSCGISQDKKKLEACKKCKRAWVCSTKCSESKTHKSHCVLLQSIQRADKWSTDPIWILKIQATEDELAVVHTSDTTLSHSSTTVCSIQLVKRWLGENMAPCLLVIWPVVPSLTTTTTTEKKIKTAVRMICVPIQRHTVQPAVCSLCRVECTTCSYCTLQVACPHRRAALCHPPGYRTCRENLDLLFKQLQQLYYFPLMD